MEREKARAEDIRQPTLLDWVAVTSPDQLKHETLVLVNPKFVFYNRREGFRWEGPDGGRLSIDEADKPPVYPRRGAGDRPEYWYTYETYQEHIERVLDASKRHCGGNGTGSWGMCALITGLTRLDRNVS